MARSAITNYVERLPLWDAFFVLAVIFSAAVIGAAVAQQRWMVFGAIGVMLLVVRWPIEVALGSLAVLLPFDSVRAFGAPGEGTPLTYYVGAFAAAVLLLTGFMQKRFHRPPAPALWWTLFIGWGAATFFWAVEPSAVTDRLATAGSLLVLYVIAVSVKITDEELHRIGLFCILGGCIAGVIASRQYAGGMLGVHESMGFRETLVMGEDSTNPGQFAASLLLPLSLAIAYFLSGGKWLYRALMGGAVALLSLSLLLTMARSSLVALVVILFIFLLRMKANMKLLVPIALLGVFISLMPGLFFQRLFTAAASGGEGRLEIWTVGIASLRQFGLFGGGLDNFPFIYDLYAGYAPKYEGMHRGSHNIYICFIVELGIIGLLLLLAAVRSGFRPIRYLRKQYGRLPVQLIGIEAGCWAMLSAAFFIDVLWRKAFWFDWILLALGITSAKAALRRDRSAS